MKTIKRLLPLLLIISVLAFAQTPTPTPTGIVVTAAASTSPGFLTSIWTFLWGPGGACLFAALYAMSELLANFFPNLAANSFFQLITKGLQKAQAKNPMPPTAS